MKMVRAIVRPEKVNEVMAGLMYAGFPAVTKSTCLDEVNNAVLKSAT